MVVVELSGCCSMLKGSCVQRQESLGSSVVSSFNTIYL